MACFCLSSTQRVSFLAHAQGGWDRGFWGVDFMMCWQHHLSIFLVLSRGEGWRSLQGESTTMHKQARNLDGKRQESVDGDGGVLLSSESSWAYILDWMAPWPWTTLWTGECDGDTVHVAKHWWICWLCATWLTGKGGRSIVLVTGHPSMC